MRGFCRQTTIQRRGVRGQLQRGRCGGGSGRCRPGGRRRLGDLPPPRQEVDLWYPCRLASRAWRFGLQSRRLAPRVCVPAAAPAGWSAAATSPVSLSGLPPPARLDSLLPSRPQYRSGAVSPGTEVVHHGMGRDCPEHTRPCWADCGATPPTRPPGASSSSATAPKSTAGVASGTSRRPTLRT